ncbi:single-stranded DNA-binding protein [Clostridium bowmanii]|uniref:DUF1413 domain-containing protein n=1 Tax=Clostridium bowmanii TaxID=132925 RepID=UPI001C0D910F|nr:DUF1413 domain-containing protein [Clostridium bowmanii]MBU3190261.1 single-stranded DNA-binding protein [Clostridium bowmanii]MCA1074764.1 single-stranded DNA-binding protein [Clostridium bowmanii]
MQELNVRIRLAESELKLLEHLTKTKGYMGISQFLTEIIRNEIKDISEDEKNIILQNNLTEEDILNLIRENIININGNFQFSDLLTEFWGNVSLSQRKKIGRLFRRMVDNNEFPGVKFLGPNSSGIALYKKDGGIKKERTLSLS